ncbi:hypothetical protein [Devosia sp.]|uniref:hypothetical protein n=1 Tax=Devosia sp. TaxID=1871048 RepID=UPI0025E154F7|nr:hypothetical protein [Devosia sp.]MCR6635008.1 hypothetical protein [Devosia sp.]
MMMAADSPRAAEINPPTNKKGSQRKLQNLMKIGGMRTASAPKRLSNLSCLHFDGEMGRLINRIIFVFLDMEKRM